MSKNPEVPRDLIDVIMDVEDVANFKEEWAHVIEPVLDEYAVSPQERILVIDELFANYSEFEEEDVTPDDVVNAIHFVRAANNDLH